MGNSKDALAIDEANWCSCPNCQCTTSLPLLQGFCQKCMRGMDAEVRQLVLALNKLPGIQTFESCCGHGEHPYRIWFEAAPNEEEGMDRLLQAVQNGAWPCGERWYLRTIDDQPFCYILTSRDIGPSTYGQSRLLCQHLKEPPFACKGTKTETLDGTDYDCEYEYAGEYTCEECQVNGGAFDPREPRT